MKKLLTVLVLIMLIISLFQIANTYALYKEQLSGDYSNLLGIWAIKVNGVDISNGGENATFTMTEDNLTYIDSARVKSQKVAPGTQAYFDILIDPTNTDVTFSYEITSSVNENSSVKDLYITGYSINDNEEIKFKEEEQKIIKDTIFYEEQRTPTKIRVFISWQDGENETMNNIADTSATQIKDKTAKVDVNIKFIQTPKAETQTP